VAVMLTAFDVETLPIDDVINLYKEVFTVR